MAELVAVVLCVSARNALRKQEYRYVLAGHGEVLLPVVAVVLDLSEGFVLDFSPVPHLALPEVSVVKHEDSDCGLMVSKVTKEGRLDEADLGALTLVATFDTGAVTGQVETLDAEAGLHVVRLLVGLRGVLNETFLQDCFQLLLHLVTSAHNIN